MGFLTEYSVPNWVLLASAIVYLVIFIFVYMKYIKKDTPNLEAMCGEHLDMKKAKLEYVGTDALLQSMSYPSS